MQAHMGETYDAPSTPGSDATTPAPEYQQSLSELKGKGIAVDDNGFPMYDPTLFGSDVRSDRQDPHMPAASSSGDKSEFQKMMEAQAGMFDANGNLLPDAQAQFQADERREREQNQARREASMFESFGRGSSSNSSAPQAGTSCHVAQNGLSQAPQPSLLPAANSGPASTRRQPPSFMPDRPGPAPNADALNGFRQDVPLQQDGFVQANTQQQAPKAPQQDPLAQFAADLNANGFEHAHNQPQAPTQRPQPSSAANANGFAHTQQPAMQSYGSDGFSDSALSGFNQPSHSVSGDFTSELWAADSRKKSQDWAWVQQQKQQERSVQRATAQQPAARQNHPQHNGVQQGFVQHSHAQPQIPPHIAAPQYTRQQQQSLSQTPAAPVYSAPAAHRAHGFDPSEALAKKVQLVYDGHDMDVGNLDDFILSSLMD